METCFTSTLLLQTALDLAGTAAGNVERADTSNSGDTLRFLPDKLTSVIMWATWFASSHWGAGCDIGQVAPGPRASTAPAPSSSALPQSSVAPPARPASQPSGALLGLDSKIEHQPHDWAAVRQPQRACLLHMACSNLSARSPATSVTGEVHALGVPAGAPAADASGRPRPAPAGGGGGTTAVYVGGLHWWTTDAELDALCREYGELAGLRFFEDKGNGKSKGYALVEFTSADAATRCKEGLNGCAWRWLFGVLE